MLSIIVPTILNKMAKYVSDVTLKRTLAPSSGETPYYRVINSKMPNVNIKTSIAP